MITPSFGLTATERVLPKLALDFTTASLDARVTFTRTTGAGNPATYVNSSGVITAATNNQPRFDYDPVTLACKGLLIEESRGNVITYSEQFDNGAQWTPTRLTVSADFSGVVAPNGTQSADKLIASTDPTTSHLIVTANVGTTGDKTWSVFFKAGEYSYVAMYEANTGKGRYFNLSAGTLGSVFVGAPNSSTIENYGNGWYRCSITTTAAGTWTGRIYMANADGSANFTGNGSDGIYVWGAQMEAGAFATSYIPTTVAALTRNADVAVMTGTNFSSWFNQTEGAITCQFNRATAAPSSSFVRIWEISDGTTSNRMRMMLGATTTANYDCTSGGSAVGSMDVGAYTANTNSKITGAFKTDNFAASQNGASPSTDVSGTISWTMNQIAFGQNATGGGSFLNGYIQKFFFYPQRITNNEVRAFSK